MNYRGAFGEFLFLLLVAALASLVDAYSGFRVLSTGNVPSYDPWFRPVWGVLIVLMLALRLIQDGGSQQARRLKQLIGEYSADWPPPEPENSQVDRLLEQTRFYHQANVASVAVFLLMPLLALVLYIRPDWTSLDAALAVGFFTVITAGHYLLVRNGYFDAPPAGEEADD